MYKLTDIFNQADSDEVSINIDGLGYEARLRQGIKITREGQDVQILNTTRGGLFYDEITSEQYQTFLESGWVIGVYRLTLVNYRNRLELIEKKMKQEVNTRKNDKHIKSMKKIRASILIDYRRVTKQINKYIIK
jgi:Fe-S cluster biosynthesis and repair protein YggX